KKLFYLCLFLAVLLLPQLTACGGEKVRNGDTNDAANEVYEFTLHHQDPPTAAMGEFFTAYAERLADASDGRIKITVYPGATLGGPADSYRLVTSGICDLAWGQVAHFPGQFPGTEAISLPMIGVENAYMGGKILWDIYRETDLLAAEYQDVHVLFLQTNMVAPLGTNKKVATAADLQGVKIRCSGGPVTQFVAKLGAVPVSIPITELYRSLERNVVYGFISDWHGVDGFALVELAKYYLDEKIQVMPFWFVMNKNKWDSLPPDIQEIFTRYSGDAALLEIEQYYNSRLQKVTNDITTAGGEINRLTAEERGKWKAAAEETWHDWVRAYEKQGINVQEVLAEVRKRVSEFYKVQL
ncbi:MAG: TRAP transporter substrate-binding protein DctP, partial [Firmicutes bacterium]|nr:TRAP transporter substrate-binding protein DctP [Bacillota bacterium]